MNVNLVQLLRSLPPVVRATIWCLVWLASLVYGLYQAAHGDWHQVALAIVPAVLGALAHANVDLSGSGLPATQGGAPAQVAGD